MVGRVIQARPRQAPFHIEVSVLHTTCGEERTTLHLEDLVSYNLFHGDFHLTVAQLYDESSH